MIKRKDDTKVGERLKKGKKENEWGKEKKKWGKWKMFLKQLKKDTRIVWGGEIRAEKERKKEI